MKWKFRSKIKQSCAKSSGFSLFVVVMFCKGDENSELVNTESVLLGGNAELGSCEPLSRKFN